MSRTFAFSGYFGGRPTGHRSCAICGTVGSPWTPALNVSINSGRGSTKSATKCSPRLADLRRRRTVERTVIPHLTTIGGLRTHRPRHSGGSGTRALPPLDPHGHDIRKLTPTPPRFGCVRRTSVSEWPEHASHLVTRRKGEPSQLWCASFLEDDADHAQALFGRAVRERAARMVLDHRGEYPSIFAASR